MLQSDWPLEFTPKFSQILIGFNSSHDTLVFTRAETQAAYSTGARKTPGWIVVIGEDFTGNKRVYKKK